MRRGLIPVLGIFILSTLCAAAPAATADTITGRFEGEFVDHQERTGSVSFLIAEEGGGRKRIVTTEISYSPDMKPGDRVTAFGEVSGGFFSASAIEVSPGVITLQDQAEYRELAVCVPIEDDGQIGITDC